MDNIELGQKLTAFRKHKKCSQKDLAIILGVTAQQVQKYEAGHNRISLRTLVKLAQHFEISLVKLIAHFERPHAHTLLELDTFENQTYQTVKLLSLFNDLEDEQRKHLLGVAENLMRTAS